MCVRVPRLMAPAMVVVFLTGWMVGLPAASNASEAQEDPPGVHDETTEILLDTSFEEAFPELPWRVSHSPGSAEVEWGRTGYRASDGRYSIYCAGAGSAVPDDGGPAPANTASWAIVGPFDLSETTAGSLRFKLWLRTEQFQDVFMWLVSTDGETYSGSARSTGTDEWQTITTDLSNWGAAGDVMGEEVVWLAFVYQSDHNNLFEGAYLDEVTLTVDLGEEGEEGRTYTTDADFAEGVMIGLDSTAGQLELSDDWDALPYVWIPNSVAGTVSKVATESGNELARFATGPDSTTDPGVAAVDYDGACWVGNRGAGTVIKIGLIENGGCSDRDGDGEIETSNDANGDGDIQGSELLAWGEDECVLVETVLVEGSEGTYAPGDDHGDHSANNLQAVAVDEVGNVWVGVYDSNMFYLLEGATGEIAKQIDLAEQETYPTAAVVDADGQLWTSSWPDPWVLGIDPDSEETTRVDLQHGSSGLALNRDDHLHVTGFEHQLMSQVNTAEKTLDWDRPAGWLANGVAATSDGRIWVAAAGDGTLTRYSPGGELAVPVLVPGGPTGVAVDQDGMIWVLGAQTETIYRLEPESVTSEVDKAIVGSGGHEATGDLTGIVARNLTSRFGTWTVDYDNLAAGTPWGTVSWTGPEPTGTDIAIRVRSSDDGEKWSVWEPAGNGSGLSSTPPGRYLRIQASLRRFSGDSLPELESVSVAPATIPAPPEADFDWAPTTPSVDQSVQFTDTSTGDPISWSWDFGDGATSELQNPAHSYESAGSYEVILQTANDTGSDEATGTVVVSAGEVCTIECGGTAPMTGELNQTVAFQANATTVDCVGGTSYTWDFGDGQTSEQQNPTHEYATTGTLRWRVTAGADGVSCSRSGDITISGAGPSECTSTYWVPVASHAEGANGSVWRTDLGLLGAEPSGAAVEVRLHRETEVVTRVVTVGPGNMVHLVDVVEWIDPGVGGSGALEICADGALVVTSRTYNGLAADDECFPRGTLGQYLAGEKRGAGMVTGGFARLGQLRETEGFRTNIGFLNTAKVPATVVVRLIDAQGIEIGSFELELLPEQWHQENRPFLTYGGRNDLGAASATVSVLEGNGVFVYASVIDAVTNDATTVPMRR